MGTCRNFFSFTIQGVETRFLEEQAHFAHFCTNKDFSRSVLSYFSPTVFPELLILNILRASSGVWTFTILSTNYRLFDTLSTNLSGCQKLPKVFKSCEGCQELPKVTKNCQQFSKVAQSCKKVPDVAKKGAKSS